MTVLSTLHTVARVPSRLLLMAIRGYQRYISPMTPPTCRFYPSCSQYAVIAVQRHGALRGTYLAVWRILRCNPWNPGGVDDVPAAHRSHRHLGAAPSAH
ncbi:membrane protein insertion efficiency factor YidD [Cellulomonas sp. URHD0024]|uniref:membrane protein insertion efficiency factor YidD n=1 Tax=Cellulomonas sp. URHD0024 TaxID=1302620 RepID=UPI000409FF74|nr:membrane protein insertion efficiency factor YidD [Cellulomonas sp. URHD0024]